MSFVLTRRNKQIGLLWEGCLFVAGFVLAAVCDISDILHPLFVMTNLGLSWLMSGKIRMRPLIAVRQLAIVHFQPSRSSCSVIAVRLTLWSKMTIKS